MTRPGATRAGRTPATGTPAAGTAAGGIPAASTPAGLPDVSLDALDLPQAVARVTDVIETGGYLLIGMVNAAKFVALRKNESLRAALRRCGLVLADGQAVVWASALLGAPLPERVAGIDLFTELLAQASRHGYRVYLLGARGDVLARCVAELAQKFPGLVIAGSRDGYFGPDQDRQVAETIRQARPDILFIGMSTPRKELFAARWGRLTGARVVHGVGGSFDIMAGITKRAPVWWQRHGLEWLYRAAQEPIRLGRRYLTTNLVFIGLVAQALARRVGRALRRQAGER